MFHSDDVNMLGRGVHAVKKSKESVVFAKNEIGLEQVSATYGTRAKLCTWNDFQWQAE